MDTFPVNFNSTARIFLPVITRMARTGALLLALAVMSLSVSTTHSFKFTPTLDATLGDFFKPHPKGWMGGDVASSTPLDNHNNTFLWLWGDTLYGYLDDGKRHISTMPRNSLSLVRVEGNRPVFQHVYVKTDAENPKNESLGFFTPEPTPNRTTWFWTFDAVSLGDHLVILANEIGTTSGPPPWNFEIMSSVFIIVENPHVDPYLWRSRYVPVPYFKEVQAQWNGLTTDDKYVFLTGYHDGPGNSPAILARIEKNLFRQERFQAIEFWSTKDSSAATWQKYSEGVVLAGLFKDFPPYKLRYHTYLKQWYSVSLLTFQFTINLLTAPDITGPWTIQPLYDIPAPWNGTGIFCYSILSHPEFETHENEFVFSFMSNGPWEALTPDLWLYVPQFVRVAIEA